jgi:hypothetical protein
VAAQLAASHEGLSSVSKYVTTPLPLQRLHATEQNGKTVLGDGTRVGGGTVTPQFSLRDWGEQRNAADSYTCYTNLLDMGGACRMPVCIWEQYT